MCSFYLPRKDCRCWVVSNTFHLNNFQIIIVGLQFSCWSELLVGKGQLFNTWVCLWQPTHPWAHRHLHRHLHDPREQSILYQITKKPPTTNIDPPCHLVKQNVTQFFSSASLVDVQRCVRTNRLRFIWIKMEIQLRLWFWFTARDSFDWNALEHPDVVDQLLHHVCPSKKSMLNNYYSYDWNYPMVIVRQEGQAKSKWNFPEFSEVAKKTSLVSCCH